MLSLSLCVSPSRLALHPMRPHTQSTSPHSDRACVSPSSPLSLSLQLGAVGGAESGGSSRLVMEQIPVIRERLMEYERWPQVAAAVAAGPLADSKQNRDAARAQAEAMLRNFDIMEMVRLSSGWDVSLFVVIVWLSAVRL